MTRDTKYLFAAITLFIAGIAGAAAWIDAHPLAEEPARMAAPRECRFRSNERETAQLMWAGTYDQQFKRENRGIRVTAEGDTMRFSYQRRMPADAADQLRRSGEMFDTARKYCFQRAEVTDGKRSEIVVLP